MRVSFCAIAVAAALCTGCADSASQTPGPGGTSQEVGAKCPLNVPADVLSLGSGTWHLSVPPHRKNSFGVPMFQDALWKGCDVVVSLAHDIGPGGKAQTSGDSELQVSADGSAWQRRAALAGASFRELAQGDDRWVLVGQGRDVRGVIAMADALDRGEWREVFRHDGWEFTSVAFGAGTFVAVTINGVVVSRDAEHWHWVNVPSPSLYSQVAFGGGRFVVAGVGVTISSVDGESWQEMSCKDPQLCVGPVPPPPSCPPGSTCTPQAPVMPSTKLALQQVRFVGGKFYAFGASGSLVSSDGLKFEPIAGDRLPAAAMGGLLIDTTELDRDVDVVGSHVAISGDDGHTWVDVPLAIDATVDCTKQPCVAVSRGVIGFTP